jgi:hypothetical protein
VSQDVNASQIAMLRGVKSCGQHHEENELAPAVQFAHGCGRCAALIFATIWNAGVEAEARNAAMTVRRMLR